MGTMMDADAFRRAMRQFASGVFVITTRLEERVHAMTATAFLPLSAEPPLVLVCVHMDSQTHSALSRAAHFGINMLSQSQMALSARFAGKTHERYRLDDIPQFHGPGGGTFFKGSAAHFEVATHSTTAGGDHTIFIARVIWAQVDHELPPLLYHQGTHHGLTPLSQSEAVPRTRLAG
jgi:flavin reductase (DIM6/NTAB) family NADH-FMN oxidoreductase RutF